MQPTERHHIVSVNAILVMAVTAMLLFLAVFWGSRATYDLYQNTEAEIRGVRMVRNLYHAVIDLQQIRSLSLAHGAGLSSELSQQVEFLQKDFIADTHDDNFIALVTAFGLQDEIADIVKQATAQFALAPTATNAEVLAHGYEQQIDRLLAMLLDVSDRAKLVLDSSLDTYYLMDVTIRRLPQVAASMMSLQSHILLHSDKPLTKSELSALQTHIVTIRAHTDLMAHSLQVTEPISPTLVQSLRTAISLFQEEVRALEPSSAGNTSRDPVNVAHTLTFENVIKIRNHFDIAFHYGTDQLLDRLAARSKEHRLHMSYSLGALVFIVVIALFFTVRNSRRLLAAYVALEQASETDPLTGIPNRRGLAQQYERMAAQARRDGAGFALGLIDIDHFKAYNDRYGHQQGDTALVAVAGALGHALKRGTDYYFRYGGEEFGFFIKVRSADELVLICDQLLAAITATAIEHADNPATGRLTASIGAIYAPRLGPDLTLDAMIRSADALLYRAKAAGRNCAETLTLG